MTGGVIPSSEQIQIELETDPIKKEKMILEFRLKAMLEERNSIYINLSRNKIKLERKYSYLNDLNNYKLDKENKINSLDNFDIEKIDRFKNQLNNIIESINKTNKQIANIKDKIKTVENKYSAIIYDIDSFNKQYRNEETGCIEIKKAA